MRNKELMECIATSVMMLKVTKIATKIPQFCAALMRFVGYTSMKYVLHFQRGDDFLPEYVSNWSTSL